MPYKNPKELLDAATALPAAIETRLPAGAPKISSRLLDFNSKVVSKLPDFPFAIPNLPPVPELPPTPGGLRRYIQGVEITPSPAGGQRGTLETAPRGSVGTRGSL